MTEPCHIIGVLENGVDGLSRDALTHLRSADLVIGGLLTFELGSYHGTPREIHAEVKGFRPAGGHLPDHR